MSKKLFKKVVIIIFLILIVRIFFIISLNYINRQSSHYIHAQNNTIMINENLRLDDHLYTILDLNKIKENIIFYIKSERKLEYSLVLNNLTFSHEIYINDRLVSHNNKNDSDYNSDYAYKSFQLNKSDYIKDTIKFNITGGQVGKIDFFLSGNNVLQDSREMRTIIHVVLLVFLVISTIISIVLYFYNPKDYYFLIFSIIGVVSVFKSIVMGELFVFSSLLGITADNHSFFDNLTSIINTILPLIIMSYLFDFNIKSRYVLIGLSIFSFLGFHILKSGGSFTHYGLMFLITFILTNIIMIFAFFKEKPYSTIIMINGVIYSSCVIYYMMVLRDIYIGGNILFFLNPAYMGAVIYIGGFLLAILLKHLDKVKVLEGKRKEYERILLLRGISHDLKLPLSVIKLNNQMMERYDLSRDEIKDYSKTNQEATLELEKMTENINSYLSLKQISATKERASIRESFEKIKHYYKFYNQYDDCNFLVEFDDKDCLLNINPLHFSRMLYNLVDNAFKYNKGVSQVTVSYKVNKNLFISIADNGIGMDEEEIEKIFNPFYRVDHSRADGGMGLGMSVVKEAVDMLKGSIEVESKKNVGTKIMIIIPI